MFQSSFIVFLFVLSVASSQFLYNYEENGSEEPETGNYDPSQYQYNPPTEVNQQFTQPRKNDPDPPTETGPRRTHIRVRSRNYNSNPEYSDPENAPAAEPNSDQRAARLQRRQARRRQRQRDYVEPTLPPRVYGPSVFENIGLGEAPSGIYIPQDSFLNVLRNPSRNNQFSQPVASTAPPATNYIQPSVSYGNNGPQQRFFVQPPSDDEPRQTNLILPVTRPQVQYVAASPRQPVNANQETVPQTVQARAVGASRATRQRLRIQSEYAAPPTVDIDALRDYTDDVARENVMSQVQYVQPESRPQSRRRSYRVTTVAPRVYSPSVFEKVGLGEAPRGIYIPEDSLLNVLLNPSGGQIAPRASRPEPRQLPPQQPTYNAPEEYEEEILEEPYQPPPPPPPPRRRSSQRSRQTQTSRRSEPQSYRSEQQDQPAVQVVQSSGQRRTQRRNDEYEDFERQRPPVQQTRSQRRPAPAPAPAPKPQPQASTSDRGQTTFRSAKLAVKALPEDTDNDGIPGEAGVSYPTFHVIPKTAFSCAQQPHNGYYADLETSCQVVHLCQSGGVQSSFLCPNGTIFSQEKFSCQWWYKVNCSDAPNFYVKNEELYKVPEKKEKRKRN